MVTEVLMARSALFENYDEDLKQLFGSLKDKLDGEAKSLTGGEALNMSLCRFISLFPDRTTESSTEKGV